MYIRIITFWLRVVSLEAPFSTSIEKLTNLQLVGCSYKLFYFELLDIIDSKANVLFESDRACKNDLEYSELLYFYFNNDCLFYTNLF